MKSNMLHLCSCHNLERNLGDIPFMILDVLMLVLLIVKYDLHILSMPLKSMT